VRIQQIIEILDGQLVCGSEFLDTEIKSACGSDLMSDVLAFVKQNCVLLTGLTHPQVIRTAEMLDVKAVVLVRGKRPGSMFIQMAQENNIALITTNYTLYTACGKLYINGLSGEVDE
jgi:predicted transcriptional regulator